jgi:hypothetical protein
MDWIGFGFGFGFGSGSGSGFWICRPLRRCDDDDASARVVGAGAKGAKGGRATAAIGATTPVTVTAAGPSRRIDGCLLPTATKSIVVEVIGADEKSKGKEQIGCWMFEGGTAHWPVPFDTGMHTRQAARARPHWAPRGALVQHTLGSTPRRRNDYYCVGRVQIPPRLRGINSIAAAAPWHPFDC